MPDDVVLTDEYEQDMPTSNVHVNNKFPMYVFYIIESLNDIISSHVLQEVVITMLQGR